MGSSSSAVSDAERTDAQHGTCFRAAEASDVKQQTIGAVAALRRAIADRAFVASPAVWVFYAPQLRLELGCCLTADQGYLICRPANPTAAAAAAPAAAVHIETIPLGNRSGQESKRKRAALVRDIVSADVKGLFAYERVAFLLANETNFEVFAQKWSAAQGNVDTFVAAL